ncbi:hypothetical protein ACS0TY_007065 [Phlomoides rotata]
MKINVDGGAAGTPGNLTGDGVFRDNFGVFWGYFAVTHGRGYTFEAELATTLYAIEIAYDNGWTKIWLESDSTYVVHILKSSLPEVPRRLLDRWHRVRRLRTKLSIVVSHIYKEGNVVVDKLTREEVYNFSRMCLPQWNLISEILSKCFHNLLLSEEMIHQNNESPSTHLRSPNVWEFLYSILFILLIAGYLVHTHLLFVSRTSSELQAEFKKVKSLMIPSPMIELRKLLDRYDLFEAATGMRMMHNFFRIGGVAADLPHG